MPVPGEDRHVTLRAAAVLAMAILPTGCMRAYNYGPSEPRYAGSFADTAARVAAPERIRIVSFNIAFSRQIDSAIVVLGQPALRNADVLLLQEMDAPGTDLIARALRMNYVYYPATRHPKHGNDFGNAVLTRWPIVADRKILLPYLAVLGATRRTATAVTIQLGQLPVRVYSTHLGTVVNVSPRQRREQLAAVLDDAEPFDRVIIGGDMNDPAVGGLAVERGYSWSTRTGPRTAMVSRLDHIFLRGLAPARRAGAGTITDNHHASDHFPVWLLADVY